MPLIDRCIVHLVTDGAHTFFNPISGGYLVTDDLGARAIELMQKLDDEDEVIESLAGILGSDSLSTAARYVTFTDTLKARGLLEKPLPVTGSLPTPFFGFIEVTRQCQTMCRICAIDTGRGSNIVLTLDEIKAIVDQFKAIGVKMVALTGGDPLVRDDLLDILRYVRSKDLIAGFSTSLLSLSEQLASALGELDVKVQVSLDGSKPETNDYNRGKGSFERARRGIDLLNKHGVEFRIAFCIMKHNIGDSPDMVDLAERLGAREVAFRKVKLLGRALRLKDEVYPSPEEMTRAYTLLYRAAYDRMDKGLRINAKYNSVFFGGRGSDYKRLPCGAGRNIIHITYKGDIVPCSLFTEDKFVQGNAKQDAIAEVWEKSELLNCFRTTSVDDIPKCKTCRYRYFCGGGCRAEAYFLEGDLLGNCCDCEDLIQFYDYFLSCIAKSSPKVSL